MNRRQEIAIETHAMLLQKEADLEVKVKDLLIESELGKMILGETHD